MAYRTPPFRSSFPMLLASSLLLVQPISSFAAGQVQCTPSGNSWSCEPIQARGELPPRPVRAAPPQAVVTDEPVGRAEPVAQSSATPQSNDFSHLDWVPREQLSAEQQAAIAPYCGGTYVEPPRSGRDDETPFDQLPVYASAESSRFEQGNETGVLEGDVLMRQGRLQARADQASFDQANSSARLEGNVRLRDQGVLVLGDQASMRIDNGETRIDNVQYVVHDARARGTAEKLMRRDDAVIVMTDGSYTTCEPGENTWSLHSNDIELDREKGWGEAKHVVLKVKDVPVFYSPYLYFPLDDRRQTGLLTPSFSQSTDNGTEIEAPYYINIAPDYDATLYPRYMSKRGLLMEGEFRYLKPDNEGAITAAYLNDTEYNENRWLYGWQHQGGLSSRWTTEVDYTDISDPFYFQDLSSSLDVRSDTYVDQRAAATYRGDGWRFQAAVHDYELATITALSPYRRLPQLKLDGANWLGDTGLRFGYNAEYTYFDRDLDSGFVTGDNGIQFDRNGDPILTPDENLVGLQRATGHRVSVSPSLSYPWRNSYAFVTPKVRVQSTYYDLDFDGRAGDNFDYGNANTTPSSTISEGVSSLVARPSGDVPIDVLFCAHIDVVHHADPAAYRSELRDNRIYGPGTGDMKGIVAILLELFRRFHLQSPGVPLALAITTDEESGGDHGTRALFEDFGLRCNVAMVPDGGAIDDIVVEEKGILHLKLEATGRACHAARPWLGQNALEQLQSTLAAIQADFPPLNADLFHWHPTCSVTRIDTPNRSVNRVPSHASATLDVRFPFPQTAETVLGEITRHLAPGVTCEPLIAADPTVLCPDPAFFDACEAVLGHPPRERREHGGSDARFIAGQNIPVIMSRPLCDNLHSSTEWIDIDSMLTFYEIYRLYLQERFGGQ